MSKIKTAEQLSDEAVTELEAALQDTDFLVSDPEQPQVSGTAEGHVENRHAGPRPRSTSNSP